MKEQSYQSWSLVIMAYNEEHTIEKVLASAVDFLTPLPEDKKEILVIDDGSDDGTFKKARKPAKEFSFIKVYRHEKNLGIGAVLMRGYRESRMENICAVPADGQFDLNELRAFRNIPNDTAAVSFYRTGYEGYGLFRKALTGANRWINRILFGVRLRDVNYVKIYKSSHLKKLNKESCQSLTQNSHPSDFRFFKVKDSLKNPNQKESRLVSESSYMESEIMYYFTKWKLKIIQAPTKHLPREHGMSKAVRPRVLKMALNDIFKLLLIRLSLKSERKRSH